MVEAAAGKSSNITKLRWRKGFETRRHLPMDPSMHRISFRPPEAFWRMAANGDEPLEAMVVTAAILVFQRKFSALIGK